MSGRFVTFDSSTALNAYLSQEYIYRINESNIRFNETYQSILMDNANSALRECEEFYSLLNGKVSISSEYADKLNLHYNYLQTTSLTEFKNYMLVNKEHAFLHDRSFFAIWNSYEISCGYPTDDMFRYANEERICWIPTSVIPYYARRIIEFGDNLRFLTREQAAALTGLQLQAIIDAGLKFSSKTPIGKRLNEWRTRMRNQNQMPEMECRCCVIE